MIIGIQAAFLPADNFSESLNMFFKIKEEVPVQACELHMDNNLYKNAVSLEEEYIDNKKFSLLKSLRRKVRVLGVHLPFYGLNPVSDNEDISVKSLKKIKNSIKFASDIKADYAVMHLRGKPENNKNDFIPRWNRVINKLKETASNLRIDLFLENADDANNEVVFDKVNEAGLGYCIDIGHLYERDYLSLGVKRYFYIINDFFSPKPFIFKGGLFSSSMDNFNDIIIKNKVNCIHIHNHDGKNAHRPLTEGKIKLVNIKEALPYIREIPVIIESDYRNYNISTIVKDIKYLKRIMA